MLQERQAEVRKRLNMLNAGRVPPKPASDAKKPCSIAASSDAATASESEDDHAMNDGDLGLGLGTVLCPKTKKVSCLLSVPRHLFKHHLRNLSILDSEVLTEAAIMQRLRRACQRKKNGKVPGGDEALELYRDTDKRLELARQLIEANFDKDWRLYMSLM